LSRGVTYFDEGKLSGQNIIRTGLYGPVPDGTRQLQLCGPSIN